MILMTEFVLGEIPFKTVYLHGLIRDAQGRKFSKSLGNGIDPIDIIDKFGADAARMSITVGNTPGTDMRLSEDRIKGYKHFANKLWNITRFILENTEGADLNAPLMEKDMAIEQQLADIAADVTKDMEAYRLYMASDKLYQYAWKELADRIIEESKPILNGEDAAAKASRAAALRALLKDLSSSSTPSCRSLPKRSGRAFRNTRACSSSRLGLLISFHTLRHITCCIINLMPSVITMGICFLGRHPARAHLAALPSEGR
jgi:valyl-tRNA synthetase